MPDNPELIALAIEAKEFKSSGFGSYLLDRAAKKAGDAARALCDVDPADTKRIIQLQMEAKILKMLDDFISEAVSIGDAEYAAYQRKLYEDE